LNCTNRRQQFFWLSIKEATARFSVDMSESVHRKLSMLAAKTKRKKVDQSADAVGGWAERGGIGVGFVHIVRSLYSERSDRFFMLPGQKLRFKPKQTPN
jgi:hypothetical protein